MFCFSSRTCLLKRGGRLLLFCFFFLYTQSTPSTLPPTPHIYNMLEARLQTGALLKKVRKRLSTSASGKADKAGRNSFNFRGVNHHQHFYFIFSVAKNIFGARGSNRWQNDSIEFSFLHFLVKTHTHLTSLSFYRLLPTAEPLAWNNTDLHALSPVHFAYFNCYLPSQQQQKNDDK